MARLDSKTRLSPPLMHVFRAAHEAKDAKQTIELRNEHGERVLAGRRLRPRHVITEPVLRREVGRDVDNLLNSIALESPIAPLTKPGSTTSPEKSRRRSSITSRVSPQLRYASRATPASIRSNSKSGSLS